MDYIEKEVEVVPKDTSSPWYYKSDSGLETIEVIEAFHLDYCLGTAFKYISRWDKKDSSIENGEKAVWFLVRKLWEDGHLQLPEFLRKLADKYEKEMEENERECTGYF